MSNPADKPRILIVDRFSSKCGVCGKGANPDEKTHETVLGYAPPEMLGEGCGAEWTHIEADCVYPGIEKRLAEMRPDLIVIGMEGPRV